MKFADHNVRRERANQHTGIAITNLEEK